MRGNVLLVVKGLRVPFESFRQALRDGGRGADVLRFGEESGGPNTVAFLKQFVRRVGRLVGGGFLVFVVGIFDEGGERARATGVDVPDFFPLGLVLLSEVRATADAAVGRAPSHLDLLRNEVDLGVVFTEPGHSQYQALLA